MCSMPQSPCLASANAESPGLRHVEAREFAVHGMRCECVDKNVCMLHEKEGNDAYLYVWVLVWAVAVGCRCGLLVYLK